MRKKQVLAVLLCVMMTFSLAACGTKAEKTPTRTQGQWQKEDSDKKEESKEDAGQEDPDKPELPAAMLSTMMVMDSPPGTVSPNKPFLL